MTDTDKQAKGIARFMTRTQLDSMARDYRRAKSYVPHRVVVAPKGQRLSTQAVETVFRYLGKSALLTESEEA